MAKRIKGTWLSGIFCVLVVGCGSNVSDLRQWTADQRSRAVPRVESISAPKLYQPLPYTQNEAIDPFNTDRLTLALQRDSSANGPGMALIAAELNRRKEPLEAYPLDTMSMVGSLDRSGRRVALVKVGDLIYQVHVGSHLGQNYGLVKAVSEHEVALREIAQDAAGEWVERRAVLQLQENKQ